MFSVRSMYLAALINNGYINKNKVLWKLTIPTKIKIVTWYLAKVLFGEFLAVAASLRIRSFPK